MRVHGQRFEERGDAALVLAACIGLEMQTPRRAVIASHDACSGSGSPHGVFCPERSLEGVGGLILHDLGCDVAFVVLDGVLEAAQPIIDGFVISADVFRDGQFNDDVSEFFFHFSAIRI